MERPTWTVDEAGGGVRLDKWLADPARLGSRGRARDALQRGRIFVDDVEQTTGDGARPLEVGMTVRLWQDRPGSAARRGPRRLKGLDIVFEDDVLLVADKEAGVLTVPLPGHAGEVSLQDRIRRHWRSHKGLEPLVVHRIDRDTSGLVVFARTQAAWQDLKRQFAGREPLRRYLALAFGVPTPTEGTWRDTIAWDAERRLQRAAAPDAEGVREATLRYRVVEALGDASLLEIDLVTGRQHQIRVQAMLHGHPLLGERLYVGAHGLKVEQAHRRQALHAAELRFDHPVSKRRIAFESPLPGDLAHLLTILRRPR